LIERINEARVVGFELFFEDVMLVVRLKGIFEAKGNNRDRDRGVSAVLNDEQGRPTAICHF
jgi:hypothetical protein